MREIKKDIADIRWDAVQARVEERQLENMENCQSKQKNITLRLVSKN